MRLHDPMLGASSPTGWSASAQMPRWRLPLAACAWMADGAGSH